MSLNDFCLRLYLWPVLSYLANIKGLCPLLNPPTFLPTYTVPVVTLPVTVLTSSTTGNTAATVAGTSTTVSTAPTVGTSPPPSQPPPPPGTTQPGASSPLPQPTVVLPTQPNPVVCPALPLACLASGISLLPGCPCIDPRQQNNRILSTPDQLNRGADVMVFSSLSQQSPQIGRRRKRDI